MYAKSYNTVFQRLVLLAGLFSSWLLSANAFSPSSPSISIPARKSSLFCPRLAASSTVNGLNGSKSSSNPITNLFRQLPWNVQKEQARQARQLQKERNALYRQLGIVEDASYEDIVAATNNLIAAAGSDLKQKVKIEMAKDQILQLRLQERIANTQLLTKEARAQSNYESSQGYVLELWDANS